MKLANSFLERANRYGADYGRNCSLRTSPGAALASEAVMENAPVVEGDLEGSADHEIALVVEFGFLTGKLMKSMRVPRA